VHFLFLGAAIFAAYGLVSRHAGVEPGRILVTRGDLASMMVGFQRTWQRPPTREEWEGMIRERVREQVYYREALALGLDKDDLIIRRRLHQKMEFVTNDVVAWARPTDGELDAYRKEHPEKFRVEPRLTFRHLYLDPSRHGNHLAEDAAGLVAKLNSPGGDASSAAMGDVFMLDSSFVDVPAAEVTKQFGDAFTARLAGISPGRWQGPIESGFGSHVVFLAKRTGSVLPPLGDVRDAVSREWDNAHRLEANAKLYREMLKRYTVTIESGGPVEARRAAGAP